MSKDSLDTGASPSGFLAGGEHFPLYSGEKKEEKKWKTKSGK